MLLLYYIIIPIILFFFPIPWTKWEAFYTFGYGGTDEEIILSLGYLETYGDPHYVHHIINYIDNCEQVYGINNRGLFIKSPLPISKFANSALVKITGFDFGYKDSGNCEDAENQAAIQAWKDWYENDYESWLKEWEAKNKN